MEDEGDALNITQTQNWEFNVQIIPCSWKYVWTALRAEVLKSWLGMFIQGWVQSPPVGIVIWDFLDTPLVGNLVVKILPFLPPRYFFQMLCTWRFFFPIIELFLTQCARNLSGSVVGERSFRQGDLSLSDMKLMDPWAVLWTENKTFQAENCIVYIFALFPKYFWLNHLLPTQGNFAPSTLDELIFLYVWSCFLNWAHNSCFYLLLFIFKNLVQESFHLRLPRKKKKNPNTWITATYSLQLVDLNLFT